MGKEVPPTAMINRLNDLTPRDWLLFQKSWFVHNPPPRQKNVLLHPAKFPETLCEQFIAFFTKPGQTVLDPMAGTGSALSSTTRGRTSSGPWRRGCDRETTVGVLPCWLLSGRRDGS